MVEYLLICVVAFLASVLTFFSGFGLGTLLLPVFAFFFPVELAVALTGVVHFFNNIFKLVLVGKNAKKNVLIYFGIPAVIAAFLGAYLLIRISDFEPLFSYEFLNKTFSVSPVNATIAILLIIFAIIELLPFLQRLKFSKRQLPLGGALSGFFGGLSGHQGALRSAFLIHAGLSKEAFIGTAVVISCFVDFTRLSVYASRMVDSGLNEKIGLIISATLAAMAGALLGRRLLTKVTLHFIQKLVAVLLVLIALALGLGLI